MYQQNYWQQLVHIHFQVFFILFIFIIVGTPLYFAQCLYHLVVVSIEVTGAAIIFIH